MIVVGAKGTAKEVLEILSVELNYKDKDVVFFDDTTVPKRDRLYQKFKILHEFDEVQAYFKTTSPDFTLGLGLPKYRRMFAQKFIDLGGRFYGLISKKAHVGSFKTTLGDGTQIMHGVTITNEVQIGTGVLVNINSSISHETTIGDFTEIACGVTIAGRCAIGDNVFIGSNATINPDVTIGNNAIIGSGAVVIKDVKNNTIVVGNPAKILRTIS